MLPQATVIMQAHKNEAGDSFSFFRIYKERLTYAHLVFIYDAILVLILINKRNDMVSFLFHNQLACEN